MNTWLPLLVGFMLGVVVTCAVLEILTAWRDR